MASVRFIRFAILFSSSDSLICAMIDGEFAVGAKNQIFIILAVLRRSVLRVRVHLRGLTSGQHSSEVISQQCWAVGDTMPDLTGLGTER